MKSKTEVIYLYIPWVFDRLGGVDVVVNNVFFGLKAQGQDVHIVEQWWGKPKVWSDAEGRSFSTINTFWPDFNGGFFRRAKNLTSFIYHCVGTLRHLRSSGVTHINAHFPTKHLFMLCMLKRLHLWNGKLVLSFHGTDVDAVQIDDYVWKYILNTAEGISACSYALKTKLTHKISTDQHSVQVIHNGIESSNFALHEVQYGYDFGGVEVEEYIICLANFVEHKGQDILIEAFAEISGKYPDITLVLAGGRDNGEWATYIKFRCCELGINDRVVFIFDVPYKSVPGLLAGAKAFVLPSMYESFGLVVAEAGLAGTAVVAFKTGGLPEIVPSDDYGLLVPVGDAGALAGAIEKTINSPQESQKSADNLKERIINEFSCKKMYEGYSSLLRR